MKINIPLLPITEKHRLAGQAIQKTRNGDSITDQELDAGIAVLRQIIPPLLAMGESYMLVFSDLNVRLSQLESFKMSRKRS